MIGGASWPAPLPTVGPNQGREGVTMLQTFQNAMDIMAWFFSQTTKATVPDKPVINFGSNPGWIFLDGVGWVYIG